MLSQNKCLIKVTTASNTMFATLSHYSVCSFFPQCKEINDASEISSLRPTIFGDYVSFDNTITWDFICYYDQDKHNMQICVGMEKFV